MNKKIISLLLAGTMALGLFTGCGKSAGSGNSAATPTGSSAASNAAPDSNKKPAVSANTLQMASLVEGLGDKTTYVWKNLNLVDGLMFRTLFLADADLQTLKPDLASDYTVSDDGLVYTINFIGGSKWSDGEALTLDDVVFSIQSNLRVATSNGIFTSAFNKIEGADAWKSGEAQSLSGLSIDGNTLTIKLSSPQGTLPQVLAQFPILPKHCLENADMLELHNNAYWSKPVTSGMYTVGELVPATYYTLVRNEYYDGPAPKIEKIIVHFVADLITAGQAGLIDVVNSNNIDVINELNKLENMTMYPIDIMFYRYFVCNMAGIDGNENPAMKDIRVRQAIMHAIDRETMADSMFQGLASTVNNGLPLNDKNNIGTKYEYNPEKAKQLLQEAGYDFNRPFRILYYYSDQTSIDFMEAVAYYLGEVGLKVELTKSTQSSIDLFQTRNYDIGYKGLSAFDISEWYNEYNSTNANFNNIFGGDTTFDELLSKYDSATTVEQRNAVLKEMQEKEAETLYKLPLYTIGNNMFVNKARVKLPEGIVFGNPWYRTDMQFENWEIIE